MNADDERLLRGRVYGRDHDDPDPGPRPGRRYLELVGGPLDGLLLDVTDRPAGTAPAEVGLRTDLGRFGPGGHSVYTVRPGDPTRLDWTADGR
ncbi:hypothetical protein ACN20G_30855 (plasmid) [Streptomyces sp. BI20]|uniref:hypothetical protein n=1 Tax=Streptomyces sp. BI20 TaxID=3403460 RepID=UPI003C7546DC